MPTTSFESKVSLSSSISSKRCVEHYLPVTNPCLAFENRIFSSMFFTILSLISLFSSFPGTDVSEIGL